MWVLIVGWTVIVLFVFAAINKETTKYKARSYLANKYNEEQEKQKQQK